MANALLLSQNEQRILQQVLDQLGVNLNDLVQKWSHFVLQVEQGYNDSIYEYTNDLAVRDMLYRVIQTVPVSLGDKLIGLIRVWDDRFNKATREVKRPLAPGVSQEAPFWWFRVPIKLTDELENDLHSEGIL